MRRSLRIFMGFFCIFICISFLIPTVALSDKFIKAKKLNIIQKVHSSVRTSRKQAGKGSGKWTEIRLVFQTKVKWVDELTVKYYALVKDPRESQVLYGEITYLNVPAGKKHFSSLFIHPATMAKFGKIGAVHCELWAKGELRDVEDFPSKPAKKWWEMKPPVKGLLVPKFYTPFTLDGDYDGLPIKVE